MFFIVWWFTLACVNDTSPALSSVQSSSATKTSTTEHKIEHRVVDMRPLGAVYKEIGWDSLQPHFAMKLPENFGIEYAYIDQMVGIVNLLDSPCPKSWGGDVSFAQSILDDDCAYVWKVVSYIDQRLQQQDDANDIVSSLAFPGPYFIDRDTGLELWLDMENPIRNQAIQRLMDIIHTMQEQENTLSSVWMYLYYEQKIMKVRFDIGKYGQKMSEYLQDIAKTGTIIEVFDPVDTEIVDTVSGDASTMYTMSTSLQWGVRSSPTWFVHGYRLRGLQSVRQIITTQNLP